MLEGPVLSNLPTESFASVFFTALGITFVALGILVVPADAFASNYTGLCNNSAACQGKSGIDLANCIANCCLTSSGCGSGDGECLNDCCTQACAGDPVCEAKCKTKTCQAGCASTDAECLSACVQRIPNCLKECTITTCTDQLDEILKLIMPCQGNCEQGAFDDCLRFCTCSKDSDKLGDTKCLCRNIKIK